MRYLITSDSDFRVLTSEARNQKSPLSRIPGEVQVEPLLWVTRVEFLPPPLQPLGIGPVETDVQTREPLLTVEHGRNRPVPGGLGFGVVNPVPFVVIPQELVELELVSPLLLDLPEEKRPNRVVFHEGIEEPDDLLRLPDELALDGGKHVGSAVDLIQRFENGNGRLESQLDGPRIWSI